MFTAFFMTGTLAPLLGASLGASPAVIGVVISAAFVFPFFFAIPAGTVVDAIGPRPMLLTGVALLGAAPLLIVLAPSLATLIVVQILTGLGQLTAVVAAQALVASLGAGPLRERNFGWYAAFVSGGQLAGPLLAGVLLDLRGFAVAYAVAVVAAAVAFVAFTAVQPSARAEAPAAGVAPAPRRRGLPTPSDLGRLVRLPTAQVSLWVSGTVMIVLITHNSFLPAFLDELAVPATVIGLVISMRSAGSVLIRPFMAQVVRLLGGRLRTFVVALATSALGVAGVVGAPNLAILLVGAALLGLAIGVAQPLTMVTMVEEVPTETHGVAFGARITANRLVQFVAPLLLGLVAQAAGYAPMFVVAAVAIGVTAVGLVVRRRAYRAIELGSS